MAKKKYWQSFSELNDSEAHQKQTADEFKEDLPFEDADSKSLIDTPASRRDFLKYLGFSTAAAVAAASCETPIRKAIPYLNKPQDMVPGVADYYATTYVNGGEAIPIVAKVRDGRPIKIEGNSLSTFTNGGTSARVQASVLDLYDSARLRFPMANKSAISHNDIDKMVTQAMAGLGGAPVVLLTSTINSPTTKQIIQDFLGKNAGSKHVQFDAVSYSGMLLANEASYGKWAIPSYRFDQADVIVSIGADFLGTWLSPIEFAKQYSIKRRINEKAPVLSKHYQFESMMSMTGANADERFTHRPSETSSVVTALLNAIKEQGVSGVTGKLNAGIVKVAKELVDNKAKGGKAVVICGSNNSNIQIIVNAINDAIGANGTTINWSAPVLTHQALDSEMETLVADMEAGRVGALLIYGVNPAYSYYNAERFKKAMAKLKFAVSFNDKMDETTELCKFTIPTPHFLESWGDAEPKTGYISLMQPTIAPLFANKNKDGVLIQGTRSFQDSLLKLIGSTDAYENYFRTYWIGKTGSADNFNIALRDGIIEPGADGVPTTTTGGGGFNNASLTTASSALATAKAGNTELVIYQKVSMGEGNHANNPWLLELPDPITRAAWDNYAMVSPQFGKEVLGIDISLDRQADNYDVHPEKPVINIKSGNKEIELPVLIIPGMQANTIAIAVGYGRSEKNGRAVVTTDKKSVGKNAYALLSYNGATIDWTATDVTATKSAATYKVATVQTHSSYEGRHEAVKEFTLNEVKNNPQIVREERNEELQNYGGLEKFEKEGTLYPYFDKPGIKWGMSIDLNTCIGCHACVVACNVENNVPVVGKKEVMRYHDMHWLRIDRYFSGDINDPESIQTIFQPMLCQHCDNAPCENVCPVAATPHSSEGLNMMTYNRCIGTRYCANNCPYKVRRFNWADYMGADSFGDNQQPLVDAGKLDDVVLLMNDDLTRMVLNPDVTVRSRGVMEKCSFCVQRLQDGKLKAKKENRTLLTGSVNEQGEEVYDVQTACQQACPTNAIVFGNSNDTKSAVTRNRHDNALRIFYSLEQLHTLPNVNYLAKVRNTEAISAHSEEDHVPAQKKASTEQHG